MGSTESWRGWARALAGLRVRAEWKLPARADEMAGVAVRIVLQIILMLRLRLPERGDGCQFRHDIARPQTGSFDIRNRILSDALLLIIQVENGRAVAHAHIVALTVARGG